MDLIDNKTYEFIAKKVSNSSGDIRVAFDLMKSGLSTYCDEMKRQMPLKDCEVKVTV